ncbi:YcbK family protein [Chelativorans sp. Marseille-P2723]|uniref:YcbK family protein n=1 Tax=Chelativorans sp. Marseille-P2723 TaxID=2709133 RepID=UPI001FEE87E8|nr:YcbK family protein [Chelativorans sp. Marseille-P2723]
MAVSGPASTGKQRDRHFQRRILVAATSCLFAAACSVSDPNSPELASNSFHSTALSDSVVSGAPPIAVSVGAGIDISNGGLVRPSLLAQGEAESPDAPAEATVPGSNDRSTHTEADEPEVPRSAGRAGLTEEPSGFEPASPANPGVFAMLFAADKRTDGKPDQAHAEATESSSGTASAGSKAQSKPPDAEAAPSDPALDAKRETVTEEVIKPILADAAEIKQAETLEKRGFLSNFFSPANKRPQALEAQRLSDTAAVSVEKKDETSESHKTLSTETIKPTAIPMAAAMFTSDALPGVRAREQLFEVKRHSAIGDDDDIDLYEEEIPYQVASASGLARLAPNGLLKQRESVDVSCLKPALVQKLRAIERHFGKRVVVTSGYRSPAHNKRVRGARNSMHMHCAAADIQIEGVTKWELANFARSLPGRGGVGTYCHTKSVHVDIGPKRDWNWRCRRKR